MTDKKRFHVELEKTAKNIVENISICKELMSKYKLAKETSHLNDLGSKLKSLTCELKKTRDKFILWHSPLEITKNKLSMADQNLILEKIGELNKVLEKYKKIEVSVNKPATIEIVPPKEVPKVDENIVWISGAISRISKYKGLLDAEMSAKSGAKNRDVRAGMRIKMRQMATHEEKLEQIKNSYENKTIEIDSIQNIKQAIDDFITKVSNGQDVDDDPSIYGTLQNIGPALLCEPIPKAQPQQSRKELRRGRQPSPEATTPVDTSVGAHSMKTATFQMDQLKIASDQETLKGESPVRNRRISSPERVQPLFSENPVFPEIPPEYEIPRHIYESMNKSEKKRVKKLIYSNYDEPLFHINERLPFVPYYAEVKAPECHPKGPNNLHMLFEFYKKLDSEMLFTLFYYMQETLVQYIAVKALKARGWRYLPDNTTWYKVFVNEDSLYMYFDFVAWNEVLIGGQCVKSDYFEDSVDFNFT